MAGKPVSLQRVAEDDDLGCLYTDGLRMLRMRTYDWNVPGAVHVRPSVVSCLSSVQSDSNVKHAAGDGAKVRDVDGVGSNSVVDDTSAV